MQTGNGSVGLLGSDHRHESEASRLARVGVVHELDLVDLFTPQTNARERKNMRRRVREEKERKKRGEEGNAPVRTCRTPPRALAARLGWTSWKRGCCFRGSPFLHLAHYIDQNTRTSVHIQESRIRGSAKKGGNVQASTSVSTNISTALLSGVNVHPAPSGRGRSSSVVSSGRRRRGGIPGSSGGGVRRIGGAGRPGWRGNGSKEARWDEGRRGQGR